MSILHPDRALTGRPTSAFVFAAFCFVSAGQCQPFWPQFRGPHGSGVADSGAPPVTLSTQDAQWATDLPPGHSSPCIWGDRIFLTSFTDGILECRAYDRSGGTELWVRPVTVQELERRHKFNNPAAPTAAADSERVVFYFGSYGLLCLSHDGKELWKRELTAQVSRGNYGSASSPIIYRDLVILALDTDEGSRLLALRSATGEVAWEAPRPLFKAGWSTPIVWEHDGVSEIVLLGFKKLTAYDPSNGLEAWSVPGLPAETVPSPACDNERVYVCSAGIGGRSSEKFEGLDWAQFGKFDTNKDGVIQITEVPDSYRAIQRPELPEGHPGRLLPFPITGMLKSIDKDKDGAVTEAEWTMNLRGFEKIDAPVLMAVRGGQSSQATENRVAWQYSRGIPEIPSPVCYRGKLFLVRDGGLVQCLEAASGKVLYQERLGVAGGYAASPVASNGRIYLTSQTGTITVIDAQAENLVVLARNPLGENITATPAFAGDSMYVRTDKHLFAFSTRALTKN